MALSKKLILYTDHVFPLKPQHQAKKLILHELLHGLQPHAVFSVLLFGHIVMQEIDHGRLDSSGLQIFMKSILQILVQVTVEKGKQVH